MDGKSFGLCPASEPARRLPPGCGCTTMWLVCAMCTVCRPSTEATTDLNDAGTTAGCEFAYAMRPSCVLTLTREVWNARCTAAAVASPETNRRLGAISTLVKPDCFRKFATACAWAAVGEYCAANCAPVSGLKPRFEMSASKAC